MNTKATQTNNLTALRWLAALMVLYGHAFVFLGQHEPLFLGMMPLGPLGVWIFFCISGYLIMQSWTHDPHLLRFMAKRALRIFPALTVCILLSILVLGPALTTLELGAYFKSPITWGYLDNIWLYITYQLPGVFATNKVPHAVNGSLWSLPVEYFMYLVVAIFGLLKVPRWTWALLALAMIALSITWARVSPDMLVIYRTDVRQVVICGTYFVVGAAFYRYQMARFFNLSSVGALTLLWLCLSASADFFILGSWFILPFITLGFGLASGAWLSKLTRFDYSYGIYIYAFPVQQTLVYLYPQQTVGEHLLFAGLITILLAGLSWHLIEKRALSYKPAG
jgi:peptidoglycan/LPS O-acetylase OafA/YrhL